MAKNITTQEFKELVLTTMSLKSGTLRVIAQQLLIFMPIGVPHVEWLLL